MPSFYFIFMYFLSIASLVLFHSNTFRVSAILISKEIAFKTVYQQSAFLCFAFAVSKCDLNVYISDVSKLGKGKEGKKVVCTF